VSAVPVAPPREAMLTIQQVARWLDCGVAAARKLNLPGVEVAAGKWRYPVGAVVAELERRAERGTAPVRRTG
jgi:hypothetical protein